MNRNALILIIAFSFINLKAFSQCVDCTSSNSLNTGLVWCHPFNGNASDATGNGYDGSANNLSYTTDRFGNSNSAASFNGTSSYVSMSKNINDMSAFTFSFWVKPNTNSVSQGYIFWEGDSYCGNDIIIRFYNGQIYFGANKNGASLDGSVSVSFPSSAVGNWWHIVWIMNGSNSKIYINDNLATTLYYSGSGYGNHNTPTYGAYNDGNSSPCGSPLGVYFSGLLDDSRLYSRAISSSEVHQLYISQSNSFSVNAGLDQIICKGDSAQLNATSDSTGTYLWSPNLNISDKNIANPKVAPPSLRKYLVTLTTSSGCIAKDSVNIFVTNISVDAGVNKTICKGDSIQLNATSAYTGTYLWSPKISISDTTIANPKVAPSASTKYVVSLLSNGCKAKDSVQINVLDVTVNAGSDQTVCIGDSIQLNTSFTNATSFSWTPKAGLSDSTISNPFVKSTSSKQYILTAANGACISRDTINISVVQCNSCTNCNTVIALNNGLVACYPFNGNTNDETGHGNNGSPSSLAYTIDRFSELNTSGDFSNSPSKVDVSPASFQLNSYTYSVWVKLNSNPTSGQLYSILSIGSDKADQFLMVSNIIGQTGFGYGSYFANLTTPDRYWSASLPSLATWYHIVLTRSSTTLNFYVNGTLMDSRSTSSSTAAYGNPSVQTIFGARVGTPTTQHFDGNIDDLRIYNRALSSTEIQSLYNLPTDRMHANAGPDVYSCKKDLIQLNGTGTGSFFTWSPIKYINNNIISNPTINPDTNITYILSVSNGTCLVFDTMKVFVTSIDANINNNDTSICLGDTVQFTTFINGDSYSWSPKMFINDTSSKSPFVFPNTTTNYFLTVTRGTCIKKDSVKITVVKNIVANAGSDQQICKGNTVQLSAFGPTGSAFLWLPNYALSNNSIPNPTANPLVDTSYFLKVRLGKNCVGYDTVRIKVNPNPTVDAGLDKDICREPFVTIGLSSTLADSFYWTPPTGLSNINILQTQTSPTSNTTYFIKSINKITGCYNFDTVTVSMIKPTASFSSDVQSGQLPLDVHFTNSSANSKTYFWDFGDTTATSTLINPNHVFTKEGLRKVMLVAENKGCTDTAYTIIEVTGGLLIFVPNVITVNGDGLNDDFVVSYTNGALKYLKGSIWNRWGGKIYDFEMPGGKWWDGKYKGVDCSEGVYFYIIEASDFADNVRTFHGTVTLLR